jgi:hypothetical protein
MEPLGDSERVQRRNVKKFFVERKIFGEKQNLKLVINAQEST